MTCTATVEIDQAAVGDFMHRFVGDLAAAQHAVTVVIGDQLGLYQALAEVGPATEREVAAAAGTRRALHPRVAQCPGRVELLRVRPGDRPLLAHPGPAGLPGRRGLADLPHRRDVAAGGLVQGQREAGRGDPHGRRIRVGRTPPRSVPRGRTVLPARLRRQPRLVAGFPRWTGCRRS